ncbi:MAG: pyrroline-5-carboxylate reductase dimerization domain-containing protein, partial [Pseudomonadota bacterium]
IAAGKTVAAIEEQLPAGGAVVRAMPNTPAAVGKGVSGLYAASGATEAQKALAEGLLSAVGPTVWVETEDELDVLTAVSGSGPAYFFHIVEALAAAGVKAGLAPEAAGALARYTAVGAGALLEASDKPADVLRTEVTSPGGVTAAALDVLMEDRAVTRLFEKAIAAGADRAKALRDG